MKRIIVNGAKLVPGGVMIPTHIVEQLRCEGVEIHHEPIGLGARRQQKIQGKAADIVIVDELFSMPVVESAAVPNGELWFRQYDPVTGRVLETKFETAARESTNATLDTMTAQLQERRVSDDPSPYFNDLAG